MLPVLLSNPAGISQLFSQGTVERGGEQAEVEEELYGNSHSNNPQNRWYTNWKHRRGVLLE